MDATSKSVRFSLYVLDAVNMGVLFLVPPSAAARCCLLCVRVHQPQCLVSILVLLGEIWIEMLVG